MLPPETDTKERLSCLLLHGSRRHMAGLFKLSRSYRTPHLNNRLVQVLFPFGLVAGALLAAEALPGRPGSFAGHDAADGLNLADHARETEARDLRREGIPPASNSRARRFSVRPAARRSRALISMIIREEREERDAEERESPGPFKTRAKCVLFQAAMSPCQTARTEKSSRRRRTPASRNCRARSRDTPSLSAMSSSVPSSRK